MIGYHDGTRIHWSRLEVFRRSPAEYRDRWITRIMPDPPATPAMSLGTAIHTAILEPDRWDATIAVAPDCDRRTTAGKGVYEAFCARIGNRTAVITTAQAVVAQACAASVRACPIAVDLLDAAPRREVAIDWDLVGEGVTAACRSRLDALGDGLVVEIKSLGQTGDPDWIGRQSGQHGYHRQAALYLEAAAASSGGAKHSHATIWVATVPPYDVVVTRYDSATIAAGRRQVITAARELAACQSSGDWRARWQSGICDVGIPPWEMTAP